MPSDPKYRYCPLCATPLEVRNQMNEQRLTCPQCGWIYYTDPKVAAGILLVKEHQVLLVRRTMQPFIRHWSIPAGFVNAFEDPREAAARECCEETGLTVHVGELFDLLYGREHPRGADILLVYRGEVTGGTLHPADDADRAAWFPLDNLPPLAFTSTSKVFKKLLHSPV